MVFSSPIFLFLFLPALLALHAVTPAALRNALLLVSSLAFYAWGEVDFLPVMLASIVMNYVFGLLVDRAAASDRGAPGRARMVVALAVVSNLALLGYFKYAAFAVANLNHLREWLGQPALSHATVALPLGISFFTFHSLSYVIDIHRRITPACRNPLDMALYISFFPQLVAGPIIRYHDVAAQILSRSIGLQRFSSGVSRFCVGLGKKMLIANPLGAVADRVFALPADQLGFAPAWLGAVAYALQIYFDFSGYSDMAIGLGRMFGFEFLENFDYPYISRSVQDFWRRWHISLSNWFRDYLYVPLGGNRRSPGRTYVNLVTVFFLCGLWHGASWTFVAWGLYHGAFLVAERLGAARVIARLWQPLQHAYALLAVLAGWVLFRADSLALALGHLRAMAGFGIAGGAAAPLARFVTGEALAALLVGAIGSMPVVAHLTHRFAALHGDTGAHGRARAFALSAGEVAGLLAVAVLAAAAVATGTYNPFIYFRF